MFYYKKNISKKTGKMIIAVVATLVAAAIVYVQSKD